MLGGAGAGGPGGPAIASFSLSIPYSKVPVSWVPAELAHRKAICQSSFFFLLGHSLGGAFGSSANMEQSHLHTLLTIKSGRRIVNIQKWVL